MLYALIAKDLPNTVERRMAVRPVHLEHLEAIREKIVFAGALFNENEQPDGSLIIVEAPTLAEAKTILEADPFVKEGIFASYEIKRWNWTFNNPEQRGQ